MRANNFKVFSYPYLASFSNDYKNNEFKLDCVAPCINGRCLFRFTYSIADSNLLEKIKSHLMTVVLRISNPSTGYINFLKFNDDSCVCEFEEDVMELDGDILIVAYLISSSDFKIDFDTLSDEWKDLKPIIQTNDTIGESEHRIITITHKKKGQKKSIFSWAIRDEMKVGEPIDYTLNTDRIVFSLPKDTMVLFNNVKKASPHSINTIFIIPIISEILCKMKDVDSDFNLSNSNKKWYKVILRKYEEAFKVSPFESDMNNYKAAQILVGESPVHLALSNVDKGLKEWRN